MVEGRFRSKGQINLSFTPVDHGEFIIVSRSRLKREDLLLIATVKSGKSFIELLEAKSSQFLDYSPLDPLTIRPSLTFRQKEALTWHLLKVHRCDQRYLADTVESFALRYKALISWGESAAAKVIAWDENKSVRTVHSRLRLARSYGLLDSPGSGIRLGNSK